MFVLGLVIGWAWADLVQSIAAMMQLGCGKPGRCVIYQAGLEPCLSDKTAIQYNLNKV
jgi:hypothetical protein